MRTAVIRINIDVHGEFSDTALSDGTAAVTKRAAEAGMSIVAANIEALPARRRELEFLVTSDDVPGMQAVAAELCREAFGTIPAQGVVTYVSRGTDDDARGVLAAFGLSGDISRSPGADGLDIVSVRLSATDLRRVPESRIQTALEASLNCEVRIIGV